jgi:ABC-2 type transport system permease protein
VAVFGLVKLVIGTLLIVVCCLVFFSFDVSDVGWGLVPVAAVLLVCGWGISLFVVGMVLRYGQGAEILAWGIPFVVMPLSGVFYPIESLPGALEPVARALPTSAAFEAARALIDGEPLPWDRVALGAGGAVLVAAAGLAFLTRMLAVFRQRGFVKRYA